MKANNQVDSVARERDQIDSVTGDQAQKSPAECHFSSDSGNSNEMLRVIMEMLESRLPESVKASECQHQKGNSDADGHNYSFTPPC